MSVEGNLPKSSAEEKAWLWGKTRWMQLFLLLLVCGACGSPVASGESHFGSSKALLQECESGECGSGNSCQCAVCTQSCQTTDDCKQLFFGDVSIDASVRAQIRCAPLSCGGAESASASGADRSASCEFSCTVDADCEALTAPPGMHSACEEGSCRMVAPPEEARSLSEAPRCPEGSAWVQSPEAEGCLSLLEVQVEEYQLCVQAGACELPERGNAYTEGRERHPINFVDATMAAAYCAYAGGALPELALWQGAVPAEQGYPWGEEEPSPHALPALACAFSASSSCEVGEHPAGASPAGVQDLAGNVAEWVQSDELCVVGGSFEAAELQGWRDCQAAPALVGVGIRCAFPRLEER